MERGLKWSKYAIALLSGNTPSQFRATKTTKQGILLNNSPGAFWVCWTGGTPASGSNSGMFYQN